MIAWLFGFLFIEINLIVKFADQWENILNILFAYEQYLVFIVGVVV